jgi:hypothetical protein
MDYRLPPSVYPQEHVRPPKPAKEPIGRLVLSFFAGVHLLLKWLIGLFMLAGGLVIVTLLVYVIWLAAWWAKAKVDLYLR